MAQADSPFPQRKNTRLSAYDYSQAGYYFITICTKQRNQDILCSLSASCFSTVGGGLCAAPPQGLQVPHPLVDLTPIGELVDRSIGDIPRYNPGTGVDIYCVMPDHVHIIVTIPGRHRGRPLPEIIGRMKSYTQVQYQKLGAPWGPKLWQESYYDHIIRNDEDLFNTRQYMQNNPLKRKCQL